MLKRTFGLAGALAQAYLIARGLLATFGPAITVAIYVATIGAAAVAAFLDAGEEA